MNQGQWDVRKKANDSRLKKICDRLERFDPEFKVWAEESKNLARAERRLNNSDPLYGAVASGSFGSQVTRKPLTGAQLTRWPLVLIRCERCSSPFRAENTRTWAGGGRVSARHAVTGAGWREPTPSPGPPNFQTSASMSLSNCASARLWGDGSQAACHSSRQVLPFPGAQRPRMRRVSLPLTSPLGHPNFSRPAYCGQ